MSSEVTVYQTDHGEVRLSLNIIRKYLVTGHGKPSDGELLMFLALCKNQRLNPFMREAFLIKYSDATPATLVVSKDVYIKRASKIPTCDGWRAGIVIRKGDAIEEREGTIILPEEELIGGWAEVYRKDWKHAHKVTVNTSEYARKKKDGTLMDNWKSMPATMVRKVALSQCLREAFPENFQLMYSEEEMPVELQEAETKEIKVDEDGVIIEE